MGKATDKLREIKRLVDDIPDKVRVDIQKPRAVAPIDDPLAEALRSIGIKK